MLQFGDLTPFEWDPAFYADLAVGSDLIRLTRSGPEIVFVDFVRCGKTLCLMHTVVRVEPGHQALLFWNPDQD